MRLTFTGMPDGEIREGVRRIGKVVREQVGLYGTLTGAAASPADDTGAGPGAAPDPGSDSQDAAKLADVVELPRRARDDSSRRLQDR
jgi:2-aminoadipate transaminase